ncbi:MAG: hypothetical protein NXY57DRAFT_1030838, partial [Lentinula lateritia]
RELKTMSKQAFCFQCQVTKRVGELKLCSRCRNARYCSAACQKEHWKTHKAFCKSPDKSKLETDDESWKNVFQEYGHKKTSVLTPVTESVQQQFMFELQRRADPPTPEHYFEMHGAEIMHASEVIALLNYMKRSDILEEWRKIPRRKDTIQIMIVWKGHIIYCERHVPNFKDLRKKAQDDPTRLGHDALANNWVEELRKAIDSADPEYHQKFYNRTWGEVAMEASFMSGLTAVRGAIEEIRIREEGQLSSEVD